jgi:CheY-like chemotaxis protein
MRGEEFLHLLQRDSTLREVPIIILSGEANAKAIADQYGLGFLAKPVELNQLQKVMSFIVDGGLARATELSSRRSQATAK